MHILTVLIMSAAASHAQVSILRQHNLALWGVEPANYSGITHVGGNTYAVIDDKSKADGFYLFNIEIDLNNGDLLSVSRSPLICAPASDRQDSIRRSKADCEDVVFVAQSNTLFIAQEETAQVAEYRLDGSPTRRRLNIPCFFSRASQQHNGGFEALAYDSLSRSFWLTTENPLIADTANIHRLVRFGHDLQASGQWLYMAEPASRPHNARYWASGISAMTALPNGQLVVMERTLSIPLKYIGGWCKVRVFLVTPAEAMRLPVDAAAINSDIALQSGGGKILPKQELFHFTTRIRAIGTNYANYEGMCMGPTLKDGRPTLLLINDSQAGAGNALYTLKDYLRVIVLPSAHFCGRGIKSNAEETQKTFQIWKVLLNFAALNHL